MNERAKRPIEKAVSSPSMIRAAIALILIWVCLFGCSKGNGPQKSTQDTTGNKPPPDTGSYTFANGSDVSWVTQMESSGYAFYDSTGKATDLFKLLGSLGINAIRLRAWVNPTAGWCNTTDLLAKALRAQNAGMSVMVDFHYSDTWADPGHQTPPAAWASLDFADLGSALYNYTVGVLDTLKQNGVTPAWVQVGNEVSNGMLWPDGEASTNMANFATLVQQGYTAVKSVFPNCKVIVHLANGYDNATYRWLFDGLQSNGAHWDVIGMSLYPSVSDWQSLDAQCLSNMQDMISRYGSQIMVSEVGMEEDSAATCEAFLEDIIAKTKSVKGGLGVFYWEPEAYNWMGYGLGAFNSNGEPTVALDAF